jgi:hypothetical protein
MAAAALNHQVRAARTWAATAVLALTSLTLSSCSIRRGVSGPNEQRFDVVYTVPIEGPLSAAHQQVLDSHAYHWTFIHPPGTSQSTKAFEVLSPDLKARMLANPLDVDEVVVCFSDDVELPRLPNIDPRLPLTAPANVQAVAIAHHMVDSIQTWRNANQYAGDTTAIRAVGNTIVKRTFWIARAMVIETPLGKLDQIEKIPTVESIEPARLLSKPPTTCSPNVSPSWASIKVGRDLMKSDLMAAYSGGGSLALLDTGVRPDHQTFIGASPFGELRDCVSHAACDGPVTTDDCCGHGTNSASILVGNGAGSPDSRGVLNASLESFRVWRPVNEPGAECTFEAKKEWVGNGLQVAAGGPSRTLAVQVDEEIGDMSYMARAADHAYDLGAAVVVAAGNVPGYGPTTPGNARRVIAAGAYVIPIHDASDALSHGRTKDGRIKPDVLAPSEVKAATNSPSGWDKFGNTSGATPFAAGAALLARNWLIAAANDPSIDPGQVYADLILWGDRAIDGTQSKLDELRGAGLMSAPSGGQAWFGKVLISRNAGVDIPIDLTGLNATQLDASLWWPQKLRTRKHHLVDTHNAISLQVIGPSQAPGIASDDGRSVFQRVRADVSGSTGVWTLRITPNQFHLGTSQVVYWCAAATRPTPSSGPVTPGPTPSPIPSP